MLREKAVEYIKKNRDQGFRDNEIQKALLDAGWPSGEIARAFQDANTRFSSTHTRGRNDVADNQSMPESFLFGRANAVVEGMMGRKAPAARPSSPARGSSSHTLKKVIAGSVVVVVLAGSAGGAFWYWNTKLAPGDARSQAIAAFQNETRFGAASELTLKSHAPEGVHTLASALAPGAASSLFALLPDDAATELSMELMYEGDTANAAHPVESIHAAFGTPETVGRGIEYESNRDGAQLYFSFNNLPADMPTRLGFAVDDVSTSTIAGQWVGINFEQFRDEFSTTSAAIAALDADTAAFMSALSRTPDRVQELEGSVLQAFVKALGKVTWEAVAHAEMLGTDSVYRFKGAGGSELTRALQGVMAGDVSKKLDMIGPLEVNVWVSKAAKKILKVSVSGTSDAAEFSYTVEFTYPKGALAVVAPEPSHSVHSVFERIFSAIVRGREYARVRERDMQRMLDLEKIQQALQVYNDAKKRYPDTLGALVPEYAAVLPKDPATGKNYQYKRSAAGYMLSAQFEYAEDPLLRDDANPKNKLYDVSDSSP